MNSACNICIESIPDHKNLLWLSPCLLHTHFYNLRIRFSGVIRRPVSRYTKHLTNPATIRHKAKCSRASVIWIRPNKIHLRTKQCLTCFFDFFVDKCSVKSNNYACHIVFCRMCQFQSKTSKFFFKRRRSDYQEFLSLIMFL